MVQAIPEGFSTLTTSFIFKDSNKAIEFYKKAFNAEVLNLFPSLDGKGIMHATLKIGDSLIMIGDEMESPNCPKSAESTGGLCPISLYMYVEDVDAAFEQAVAAGGKVMMPVSDMFWGDRSGQINDPFGYSWMITSHTKDLSEEEVLNKAKEFFASIPN